MKKVVKIFSIMLLVLAIIIINGSIKAVTPTPTATPNQYGNSASFGRHSTSKLIAGQEIELIINLKSINLQTGDGISGIAGKLEIEDKYFDKTTVKTNSFEGLNDWTVAGYDQGNTNFYIDRLQVVSELSDMFKIKLKVKDDVVINANDYATIRLYELTTAGGTVTGNISVNDVIAKIGPNGIIDDDDVTPVVTTTPTTTPTTAPTVTPVITTTPVVTTTQTTPTATTNGGGNSNQGSKSGSLPQTGDAGNIVVIGSLVGMVGLTIFGFIKYKKLDR